MARYGDTGPYAKNNVRIVTCTSNAVEVRSRETGKEFPDTIKDGLDAVQRNKINLP